MDNERATTEAEWRRIDKRKKSSKVRLLDNAKNKTIAKLCESNFRQGLIVNDPHRIWHNDKFRGVFGFRLFNEDFPWDGIPKKVVVIRHNVTLQRARMSDVNIQATFGKVLRQEDRRTDCKIVQILDTGHYNTIRTLRNISERRGMVPFTFLFLVGGTTGITGTETWRGIYALMECYLIANACVSQKEEKNNGIQVYVVYENWRVHNTMMKTFEETALERGDEMRVKDQVYANSTHICLVNDDCMYSTESRLSRARCNLGMESTMWQSVEDGTLTDNWNIVWAEEEKIRENDDDT